MVREKPMTANSKPKKFIDVRTAGSNESLVITIPRPLAEALNIAKGDQLLCTLEKDHLKLELATKMPTE